MVNADDFVGFGAIVATDEVIDKYNNPLSFENFYVQGNKEKIFINSADNLDDMLFIKLYEYLEKKRIIIKKFNLSTIWTMDFKFITSDKSLLSPESLRFNLKDFTNKDKVNYTNLSNFLKNYKYKSNAHLEVFALLKQKSILKKGGKLTKNVNRKNKNNKTCYRNKKK